MSKIVRPFVKWAGGKSRLLSELVYRCPREIETYYEPFVGGGALFFALHDEIHSAELSDLNSELILTYNVVKHDVNLLLKKLHEYRDKHNKDYYYEIRSKNFVEDVEVAARFIYLNKTCYSGLYRVNKKNKFNVPIGNYTNPPIVQADKLLSCTSALKNVHVKCHSFENIDPSPGDFVYFDPPYYKTFTQYTRNNFGEEDQYRLRDFASQLVEQGVNVMLSNSDTNLIREAFSDKMWQIDVVNVGRGIGGRAKELIITNGYERRKGIMKKSPRGKKAETVIGKALTAVEIEYEIQKRYVGYRRTGERYIPDIFITNNESLFKERCKDWEWLLNLKNEHGLVISVKDQNVEGSTKQKIDCELMDLTYIAQNKYIDLAIIVIVGKVWSKGFGNYWTSSEEKWRNDYQDSHMVSIVTADDFEKKFNLKFDYTVINPMADKFFE